MLAQLERPVGPLTAWRRGGTVPKIQNRDSPLKVFHATILEHPDARIVSIQLNLTKSGDISYTTRVEKYLNGKRLLLTGGGIYVPEVDYEEHPFIDPREPKFHRFSYSSFRLPDEFLPEGGAYVHQDERTSAC